VPELLYQVLLWSALAVGLGSLLLGLLGKVPGNVTAIGQAVLELGLLALLVTSIVLVAGGKSAATSTVEFFAYLVGALIIPVAAVFWSLLERSRWSTVVLGVSGLAIVVMVVRMHQIWTGSYL